MNYRSNIARMTGHDRPAAHDSCVRRALRLRNALGLAVLLGFTLSTSCNPTAVTVLQATFNNDTVGSPPAFNQEVGTLIFSDVGGRIIVVNTPAPNVPSTKWVQIRDEAMRFKFSRADGPGNYGLLASIVIPNSTPGIVTLLFVPDFDPQGTVHFMHLDFMPSGDVRVDDGEAFGRFPKDRPFTLSVKLNITNTAAVAEITLFGTGASGSKTVNIEDVLLTPARRFDGVNFRMGFQQQGTFFLKDVIVTRTQ